jgi:hypothetical protein
VTGVQTCALPIFPQAGGALLATIGSVAVVLYWPRPLEAGEEEEPLPGDAKAAAGERRE